MIISEYEITSFCDLSKKQNELVYISAIYSGVEEYWGLSSVNNDCRELNPELEIPEKITIKPEFEKLFVNVIESYWNKYLIIDAIGILEMGNKSGYGHLGTNNSKFTVQKIINVQLITRKK